MSALRILIIIPCHNERDSIADLLAEIADCNQEYETLVVDDGSLDGTHQISRQFSPAVKLLWNLGIGGAVQTGIKYAHYHDYDLCIQIDGDGQHPPSEVSKLLQAYRDCSCSIIIGSRYINHDTFRSTWARRFGSKTISLLINMMFSECVVTDPTSGMRLMDRKAIKFFAGNYPHDFPEPISLAWALKAGILVGEVPVQMRARTHGNSSIAGFKAIIYMLRVLAYITLARFIRIH